MVSLCLDCILFTLKGRPIAENKYIEIFKIWLSLLRRNGRLGPDDLLHIRTDSETFNYIRTDQTIACLLSTSTAPIQIAVFDPPYTLSEGMMHRYTPIEYSQKAYMYCDIDVLVLSSLHEMIDRIPYNTLSVHGEGRLRDDIYYYGSAFTAEELALLDESSVGISSGKFIIHGRPLYQRLMTSVQAIERLSLEKHWTLDQPYFNRAVYLLNSEISDGERVNIEISLLTDPLISTNLRGITEKTVLADFMGMPGDGEFHRDKIVNFYILFNS